MLLAEYLDQSLAKRHKLNDSFSEWDEADEEEIDHTSTKVCHKIRHSLLV